MEKYDKLIKEAQHRVWYTALAATLLVVALAFLRAS